MSRTFRSQAKPRMSAVKLLNSLIAERPRPARATWPARRSNDQACRGLRRSPRCARGVLQEWEARGDADRLRVPQRAGPVGSSNVLRREELDGDGIACWVVQLCA